MKRWQRVAVLTLVLLIAVSSVWQTVRLEQVFWSFGSAQDSAYATFGRGGDVDLHGLDVREVVYVQGVGREDALVTLANGTWRATVEATDSSIDEAKIASTGEHFSSLSWSILDSRADSRAAVFVVGDYPDPGARLYGPEFSINTNAIEDHYAWSVTLERFGRR